MVCIDSKSILFLFFEKQHQHFIAPESRAFRCNLFVSSQPVIQTLGEICFFFSLPYRFFAALRMTRKNKKYFRCNPVQKIIDRAINNKPLPNPLLKNERELEVQSYYTVPRLNQPLSFPKTFLSLQGRDVQRTERVLKNYSKLPFNFHP